MRAVLNKPAQYRAIQEKAAKYDGIFYFVNRTTGRYCKVSCRQDVPSQKDCLFFSSVQTARCQGYVPCSQCCPDPFRSALAIQVIDRINAGDIDSYGIHGLANSLLISERHLRRIVHEQTGISPNQLNRVKRLNDAKYFVTKTQVPIIEIAFNVGFSSLRQFNYAFKVAYKTSPREMRKIYSASYSSK